MTQLTQTQATLYLYEKILRQMQQSNFGHRVKKFCFYMKMELAKLYTKTAEKTPFLKNEFK